MNIRLTADFSSLDAAHKPWRTLNFCCHRECGAVHNNLNSVWLFKMHNGYVRLSIIELGVKYWHLLKFQLCDLFICIGEGDRESMSKFQVRQFIFVTRKNCKVVKLWPNKRERINYSDEVRKRLNLRLKRNWENSSPSNRQSTSDFEV